jgi:hypothetical protein
MHLLYVERNHRVKGKTTILFFFLLLTMYSFFDIVVVAVAIHSPPYSSTGDLLSQDKF